MRLNKSTNHAIRILIECARSDGDLTKVAQLAERLDITQQNTFKIVHLLSRAGYLEAQRGRYGGVKLARPAADIKVGQVVRAMELGALDQGDTQKAANPGLNQIIDDALNAFIEVLDQNTLQDMVQKTRTKKATAKTKAKPKSSPAKPTRPARSKPAKTRKNPKPLSKHASYLKGASPN